MASRPPTRSSFRLEALLFEWLAIACLKKIWPATEQANRKQDKTEQEERHSFSSARAAGRPVKNTPSATRKTPIQRREEIASPKKNHDPTATMIWFVAAKL